MKYGYGRCSTNETKQDIDRQRRELEAAGADIVICEYEHGDAKDKAELDKLLAATNEGDTIIVAEVSRLSRSTKQLCDLIEQVKAKRLCLSIINSITIDCRNGTLDPMSAAFLQMAGVFAELELSMIRARVKSGMANAAAKGHKAGRPRTTADHIPDTFLRYYPRYKVGTINKVELSRLTMLTRPTVDKYIRILEADGE